MPVAADHNVVAAFSNSLPLRPSNARLGAAVPEAEPLAGKAVSAVKAPGPRCQRVGGGDDSDVMMHSRCRRATRSWLDMARRLAPESEMVLTSRCCLLCVGQRRGPSQCQCRPDQGVHRRARGRRHELQAARGCPSVWQRFPESALETHRRSAWQDLVASRFFAGETRERSFSPLSVCRGESMRARAAPL